MKRLNTTSPELQVRRQRQPIWVSISCNEDVPVWNLQSPVHHSAVLGLFDLADRISSRIIL